MSRLLVSIAVALLSCSRPHARPPGMPALVVEPERACFIQSAELGAQWPLTVDSGWLECRKWFFHMDVIVFHANGKAYHLNGCSLSEDDCYAELSEVREITRETGTNFRGRKSYAFTSPLADAAKPLCK